MTTKGLPTFDRAARVALIGEAARALLRGELPSRAAQMFVGGGLLAWLENGGDLARDFWRIAARAGSHQTPSRLFRDFLPREEPQTVPEPMATVPVTSPDTEDAP